jgi:uncharacterized surface protein with fasciclin (FAS1) repeats
MKKITTINRLFGLITFCLLILIGIWGCKKESLVYNTTTDVNITSYLDEYPETFSLFKQILDITGNSSFLNAYGAYTLFAPTNDAVKAYLITLGKTSVDQVDVAVLKDMVRFHLLSDTIRSNQFTDGKLPSLTMYGQYLITGAVNVGGITKTVVNRQANIIKSDIVVGNGIIHSIDHVLTPAIYTSAQLIEKNPKYSIFTQALKETGLYDTLNILPANNPKANRKYLTALAESDSIFKVAGFTTYAALKARLCKTGDPKNTTDSLYLFMAYHIMTDAKYLADIASSQSQSTLAPMEILSTSLVGTTILINDVTFLGVHEPGIPMDRINSDNSATNGVLHSLLGHVILKVRKPVRVDWDVADFPEIRKQSSVFRKSTTVVNFNNQTSSPAYPIADYTWQIMGGAFGVHYSYSPSGSTTNYALYQDIILIDLGGPNRPSWYELRTPLIVKGQYKVWVGYRNQKASSGSTCINQVLVDGNPMAKLVEFTTPRPAGTDAELEAQGWKQYCANSTTAFGARLVGIVNIQTTDRHIFRIQNVSGSQSTNNFDIVQFIPVTDDQVYPRFNPDGTLVPHP